MGKRSPNATDTHRVRLRRNMLSMSQRALGEALGVPFQQLQRYENGTDRIWASRLQQISRVLEVPVAFFFDGARRIPARRTSRDRLPSLDPLIDFMKTRDGLALAKAFMQIGSVQLKRRIVDLVEHIEQSRNGPAR
jgi:transcriptional regulator with XRE-family HTH domain